ncbi:MAG: TonB family protein [Prolixibacteraceae bacterium]|nr:TonB family protein [Prolixibacteraceae bacterium]
MKDPERLQFEKELERDAFYKNAVEGLSKLKADDIERDINSFAFIRPKKIQFQKAAVVLFIIAIFSVLIFLFLRRDEKDQSEDVKNENVEILPSIDEENEEKFSDSIRFDSTKTAIIDSIETFTKDTTSQVVADTDEETEQSDPEPELNNDVGATPEEEQKIGTQQPQDKDKDKVEIKDPSENEDIENEGHEVLDTVGPVMDEKEPEPDRYEEETTVDEIEQVGQNEENTVDSIADEADEKSQSENNITPIAETYIAEVEPRPGVNAEPKPLGGQALFDKYIENNLRYPVTGKGREVVKIEFTITVTGELTDFKVLRSPDNKAFEREAIRVVSEGPKWSPAIEDGIPVREKERLRIVFRDN